MFYFYTSTIIARYEKILYTLFILFVGADSMSAHLFTLPDGRTIEATIRSFNGSFAYELERLMEKW